MNPPADTPVTTNHLRASYERNEFSFGNPGAATKVVLVGSCRIVPILNYLRAYNALHGGTFDLVCLNPVEMWKGVGSDVGRCASERLKGHQIGKVDFLICETLKNCGVLNTLAEEQENIFDSLGCDPRMVLRIPNWHHMHIFSGEVSIYSEDYRAMGEEAKVEELRRRNALFKSKFLENCRRSSFPELEQWVEENWLTKRLGWSSEHVSRTLSWKFFELICRKMELPISPELAAHPFCVADPYASTGTALTHTDYAANNWKF